MFAKTARRVKPARSTIQKKKATSACMKCLRPPQKSEKSEKKGLTIKPLLCYTTIRKSKGDETMKDKLFENVLYIVIVLLLAGQILVGKYYLLGQSLYLGANAIAVARSFALKRPTADKIKDSCFFGVTAGLILLRLI